jgi:hypothetical protein
MPKTALEVSPAKDPPNAGKGALATGGLAAPPHAATGRSWNYANYELMNDKISALIVSACVVIMPCGKPW